MSVRRTASKNCSRHTKSQYPTLMAQNTYLKTVTPTPREEPDKLKC